MTTDNTVSPKSLIFLFLVLCLCFSSFRWNVFGIEKRQVSDNIGLADVYIVPAMQFYTTGPSLQRTLGEIQVLQGGKYSPYFMQVGLQRILYSALSPRTVAGVNQSVPYLRAMVEALLALTFLAFIAATVREFGYPCAGITAALLALSNWLIVFAPDLFWICATFFVPFVLAWVLGDPARPSKQRRLLAILFTIFCLIKCLCGFDYITNIFAAVAAPFVYYGLKRGVSLTGTLTRLALYGSLSLIAFCLAVAIQITQFAFVQGDLSGSLRSFAKEAGRRTLSNGEGLRNGYDEAALSIIRPLHLPTTVNAAIARSLPSLRPELRYLRYLSMGAATLPLPLHALKLPIWSFIAGFLLAFWIMRKRLRKALSGNADRTSALMWATLTALLVSHLWIVAANGHMTHTFFNAIVFYIPFLPMAYIATGVGVASVVRIMLGHTRGPSPV